MQESVLICEDDGAVEDIVSNYEWGLEELKTKSELIEEVEEVEEKPKAKENHLEGPDFKLRENKDRENETIIKFQKNGDPALLEEVYNNRIPTLNYWARRNKHLEGGNDFKDIRSELTRIFMKTIKKYELESVSINEKGQEKTVKRDFNTYLYSSFSYALCNIYNKGNAKKRTFIGEDGSVLPSAHSVLSLDYVYGNDDNGSFTLKDVIADTRDKDGQKALNKIRLNEILDLMAGEGEEPEVKLFLKKICEGSSVTALLKEMKTIRGKIKPTAEIFEQVKKSRRKPTRIMNNLIEQKVKTRFKLIDFEAKFKYIYYEIELHKTPETSLIMKRLRQLKRQKDFFIGHLKKM